MLSTDGLPGTLEFIRSNHNPDGGWGYRPGGASYVEPTAFCILAMLSAGEKAAAASGLAFLKACQDASGAMRDSPGGGPESWMAYAALLAYDAVGAPGEKNRLIAWILKLEDGSRRFTTSDIKAILETYRYDASIPGWPWTVGTTAWVEPTALFVIALVRAGVPLANERILEGVRLIIDRKVHSGGWNFGNPYSKTYELQASPLSTSLALIALAAAGYSGRQSAVGSGVRFLQRCLAGDVSTVSLAWALIALKAYRPGGELVKQITNRLAGLRKTDGGFRRNLFESALAHLALHDASAIMQPAGQGEETGSR
jgi:hypothetical protein